MDIMRKNPLLRSYRRVKTSLRREFKEFLPILPGLFFILVIIFSGILFYTTVEGWRFVEALYMVIITLSTVGYGETRPLSDLGRVVTMVIIISGVGTFFYTIGVLAKGILEGRFRTFFGKHKMSKKILHLKNHFIICGFGRIGKIVANELSLEEIPFVVVEKDHEPTAELEKLGYLHVIGDATQDEVLLSAGLKKASTMIAALHQEAANVFVTLTARQFNPEITIIARSDSESAIEKLKRAGADRVIQPHVIGGKRMAQVVLRPSVIDFLDLAMAGEHLELQMEELLVSEGSEIAGKDLIASQIRPRFNLIIVGVMRKDEGIIFNPQPQEIIRPGDVLIVMGHKNSLKQLQENL